MAPSVSWISGPGRESVCWGGDTQGLFKLLWLRLQYNTMFFFQTVKNVKIVYEVIVTHQKLYIGSLNGSGGWRVMIYEIPLTFIPVSKQPPLQQVCPGVRTQTLSRQRPASPFISNLCWTKSQNAKQLSFIISPVLIITLHA